VADALSAHERALKLGGVPGIINLSLIESAIGRVYSGYNTRIEYKAAALVQSMAGNHGFADGNKRTALLLLSTLLERSAYSLSPLTMQEDINDEAEQMILDTVCHQMNFDELLAWFKLRIRRAKR
jgi:death-on-curing protein